MMKNITPIANLHDRERLIDSKDAINTNFNEFQTIFVNKTKLSNLEPDYFFSVLQLESINQKALVDGKREAYEYEISSKVSLIKRFISEIDNNTILIALSDTGI